jgi:hypothetical protein
VFWLAGIVFLGLPIAFYGWQLFSPRHLMTTALAVLIVATGWRGRAHWRWGVRFQPRLTGTFAVAAGCLTLVSLMAGLHLPAPERPQLVGSDATRFPTADGLWPMGATISFLAALRSSPSEPIDHNQAIWKAATRDEVRWPVADSVPVLETPMRKYLFLATRWAGHDPVLVGTTGSDAWHELKFAVSDERSLRTLNPGQVNPGGLTRYESFLAGFKGSGLQVISPEIDGHTVVQLSAGKASGPIKSDRDFEIRRTLAGALRDEEFRRDRELSASGSFRPSRSNEGKTLVLSSPQPFTIDEVSANPVTDFTGSPLYTYLIPGDQTLEAVGDFSIESEKPVTVWSTVLPDYMSRNRFRSDRDNAASRKSDPRRPREIAARSGSNAARGASAP